MKYASSIRYGGEIIEAEDCDYESYKHLGLLCPECKDPVFLKAEGLRILKGKEVRVNAHFSHFPGKDPMIVMACENRIKTYSKEELKHKAAQSRGQRLKLIQRWFYQIIKNSPLFQDGLQKANQLGWFDNEYLAFDEFKEVREKMFDESYAILCSSIKQNKLDQAISEELDREISQGQYLKDCAQKAYKGDLEGIELECFFIELGSLSSEKVLVLMGLTKIDRQMQKLICREILDFLTTPRAKPILTEILLIASALSDFMHVYEIPEYVHALYKWTKDKGVTSCFCQMITQVLWQSEFEKMTQMVLPASS